MLAFALVAAMLHADDNLSAHGARADAAGRTMAFREFTDILELLFHVIKVSFSGPLGGGSVVPEPNPTRPVGRYRPEIKREFLIWRPVMAGRASVGEIRRREVLLLDLNKLNHLMDAEAAAEIAAHEKGK